MCGFTCIGWFISPFIQDFFRFDHFNNFHTIRRRRRQCRLMSPLFVYQIFVLTVRNIYIYLLSFRAMTNCSCNLSFHTNMRHVHYYHCYRCYSNHHYILHHWALDFHNACVSYKNNNIRSSSNGIRQKKHMNYEMFFVPGNSILWCPVQMLIRCLLIFLYVCVCLSLSLREHILHILLYDAHTIIK